MSSRFDRRGRDDDDRRRSKRPRDDPDHSKQRYSTRGDRRDEGSKKPRDDSYQSQQPHSSRGERRDEGYKRPRDDSYQYSSRNDRRDDPNQYSSRNDRRDDPSQYSYRNDSRDEGSNQPRDDPYHSQQQNSSRNDRRDEGSRKPSRARQTEFIPSEEAVDYQGSRQYDRDGTGPSSSRSKRQYRKRPEEDSDPPHQSNNSENLQRTDDAENQTFSAVGLSESRAKRKLEYPEGEPVGHQSTRQDGRDEAGPSESRSTRQFGKRPVEDSGPSHQPNNAENQPGPAELDRGDDQGLDDVVDRFMGMAPENFKAFMKTSFTGKYKHVMPKLREGGYKHSPYELVTNMFQLQMATDEFHQYEISWQPPEVGNKGGVREWRRRVFKAVGEEAKRRWAGHCDVNQVLKAGLGAWDCGHVMYRRDQIPPDLLTNLALNPVEVQLPLEMKKKLIRNPTSIQATIVAAPTTLRTNVTRLVKGEPGHFMTWKTATAGVLQSVLFMFPGIEQFWIEDRKILRMFYPPGYFNQDGGTDVVPSGFEDYVKYPDAIFKQDSNSEQGGQRRHSDNTYVVRTGYRMTPKISPAGIFVNVWVGSAPFFKDGVDLQTAIDSVFLTETKKEYLRRYNQEPQGNAILECLIKLKCYTPLDDISKGQARRVFTIYGFSSEPCGKLNVGLLRTRTVDERRKETTTDPGEGTVNLLKLFDARFKERLLHPGLKHFKSAFRTEGDFKFPAVKIHPRLDLYMPPWALMIKEYNKHPSKPKGHLAWKAHKFVSSLRANTGAERFFGDLQQFLNNMRQRDRNLRQFGITVNAHPLQVLGNILEVPTIRFGKGHGGEDSKSESWRKEWTIPSGSNLLSFPTIHHALTFYQQGCNLHCDDIREFFESMIKMVRPQKDLWKGLMGGNRYCKVSLQGNAQFDDAVQQEVQSFRSQNNDRNPQIVFLFLEKPHPIYNIFKTRLDIFLGIPSQVIVYNKQRNQTDMGRGRGQAQGEGGGGGGRGRGRGRGGGFQDGRGGRDPGVAQVGWPKAKVDNLTLKLKRKVGSRNIAVRNDQLESNKWMIFGADVTHPAREVHHSIASVVGTTDQPPSHYAAKTTIQAPGDETILWLGEMLVDLIELYERTCSNFPVRKVLFFRDGVSEEQMSGLFETEIPKIYEAFRARGYGRIQLTYVVCVKRHHTRFKVVTGKDINNNQGFESAEIKPGTVVNDLPHFRRATSFYLCSHLHTINKNLGGCARPTLYHVLLDENRFKLDKLQTLIYHQCFGYDRCKKPLSIIPAVHYCHLAAFRARIHYTHIERIKNVPWPLIYRRTTQNPHEQAQNRMIQYNHCLIDPGAGLINNMYYI